MFNWLDFSFNWRREIVVVIINHHFSWKCNYLPLFIIRSLLLLIRWFSCSAYRHCIPVFWGVFLLFFFAFFLMNVFLLRNMTPIKSPKLKVALNTKTPMSFVMNYNEVMLLPDHRKNECVVIWNRGFTLNTN